MKLFFVSHFVSLTLSLTRHPLTQAILIELKNRAFQLGISEAPTDLNLSQVPRR